MFLLHSRWKSAPQVGQTAVIVWAIALIVVAIRVLLAPITSGSVFPVYSAAANWWVAGEDLYTLDFTKHCYRYQPVVAVSFVPWAALPLKFAALLWRGLGVALLLFGVRAWMRRIAPRPLSPSQQGIALILLAPLAFQSINNAQVNVHLLGLLLLGLAAASRERWTLAAFLVAIATFFKLYPIAVGLLLVVVHPRQFAPRYFLMLLIGSALPFLTQRFDYVCGQYELWVRYLHIDNRLTGAIDQAPRDLYLLLRVWFVAPPLIVYQIIQAGAALLIAIICHLLRRRGVPIQVLYSTILNLGCLWMTLLGPSTESSTYTLLGVTAASMALLSAGRSRLINVLAWIGIALLSLPAIVVMFPGGKIVQYWGPQPAGALLLLIVVLADLYPFLRYRSSAFSLPYEERERIGNP